MSDANDEALLSLLVGALAPVPGIEAMTLGGSRARGTATAASDYDIGLYYRGRRPIDIAACRPAGADGSLSTGACRRAAQAFRVGGVICPGQCAQEP